MSSSQFNSEHEQNEGDTVTLVDEHGNSLECYVEHSLESGGVAYLLLMPVDIPIIIISWEDDPSDDDEALEAIMLEDYEEINMVFGDAKAVLAEQNLYLNHTAYTLTATGELPPIEEDNILTLNLDEEDSQLESEELQFLASFYHSQQKYSIYTPMTPLLFFAKQNWDKEIELVSPEEERFQSILEELLFEELE